MKRFLAENDPAEMPGLSIRQPMLVVVGTNDDFVPVKPLGVLIRRQRQAGAPITFITETDGDHFSNIKSAQARILGFARQEFAEDERTLRR